MFPEQLKQIRVLMLNDKDNFERTLFRLDQGKSFNRLWFLCSTFLITWLIRGAVHILMATSHYATHNVYSRVVQAHIKEVFGGSDKDKSMRKYRRPRLVSYGHQEATILVAKWNFNCPLAQCNVTHFLFELLCVFQATWCQCQPDLPLSPWELVHFSHVILYIWFIEFSFTFLSIVF